MVNRSHILLMKPSDPKAADNLHRDIFCLIISFQTALLTWHATLTEEDGCNIHKLEALFACRTCA